MATFVVGATPGAILGIPSFARGPDGVDPINLPNSATTGIPLNLSNASGVTSGTFTLTYNPALLSITAASVNTSLTGASLSLDAASTPGTAILDFSSPTALTASTAPVRLGGLIAIVPNSAASLYKSKALLHWSGMTLNGGAIAVEGDDSVQVVAYFGDASGSANGSLSAGDASDISAAAVGISTNIALGTLSGFSAFPLADPAIIADLNNDGLVDSSDVTLLNSVLAGIPRAQIPAVPTGLNIVATGPDPLLSLPATLQVGPDGSIVVPVDIDTAHPLGSTGATEAILALRFNPQLFSVSADDVQLGTLTAGWQLTTVVNAQTGEIGIDVFGDSPIQTTAAGSLVTITVGSRQWAVGSEEGSGVASTPLSLVSQVDPTGHRAFTTTVADGQGAFVLQYNSGQTPGGSGQLTVTNTSIAPDETTSNAPLAAHSPLPTAHYYLPNNDFVGDIQCDAYCPPPTTDDAEGAALTTQCPLPAAYYLEWISDDYVAYLKQAVKPAATTPGLSWLEELETDELD